MRLKGEKVDEIPNKALKQLADTPNPNAARIHAYSNRMVEVPTLPATLTCSILRSIQHVMNVDVSAMNIILSKPERRAILMIAVGERPWHKLTSYLFQLYATKCGADLHVVTNLPSRAEFPLEYLPNFPGRPHKQAYAAKAFLPWRLCAQQGYDRVLVVDDSCCIRPDSPDIFDYVPDGHCGYIGTDERHAENSFSEIRATLRRKGLSDIDYIPELYMNSGVMVYTRGMIDAINPERVLEFKRLLFAAYPHQTLTYYLLRSRGVPMTLMPKAFNSLPATHLNREEWSLLTDPVPHIRDDDEVCIYHVTGAYKHRDVFIPNLAMHLLDSIEPATAALAREIFPIPKSQKETRPSIYKLLNHIKMRVFGRLGRIRLGLLRRY